MNDLYKPFAFGDTGTTLEEALKDTKKMHMTTFARLVDFSRLRIRSLGCRCLKDIKEEKKSDRKATDK